jgi:hypothetical protein
MAAAGPHAFICTAENSVSRLYVHTQVCGRDVHTALQRDGNFATVNVLMLDDVT